MKRQAPLLSVLLAVFPVVVAAQEPAPSPAPAEPPAAAAPAPAPAAAILTGPLKVAVFYPPDAAVDVRRSQLFVWSLRAELQKLDGVELAAEAAPEPEDAATCPENRSCLAKLARALGADVVVLARTTRLGARRMLSLKRLHIESGEVAQGAADRMKREVEETRPDLVVWQVGTNDALRHVGIDRFVSCLKTTLAWLAENKIDVVLIDPQYVERLAKDQQYLSIVDSIAEVAREKQVLLVHRYDAMADLSREHPSTSYLAGDRFHLNDLGYRCMAEYAARAIVAGILQADIENAPIR